MSPKQRAALYRTLFFPFTNNTFKALERRGKKSDGTKELDMVECKSKEPFLDQIYHELLALPLG